ncbi:MAG TPA: HU family DNA-binding protein [candidate division Zixibacteria bacterium]|jgi:DNA-binding protein HU-beta|nr:HU family DNA-binding protein [Candidatus Latescibacterota bacterium]MDP7238372.1 HU family DNA-binding protein [Candidatus Latescibacterota bacterium]HIG48859.1 HU family DNA-binding protein [candidate division Zixibacteria bacterium]
MNRAELAAQVADAADLSKSDADSAVAATLDAIKGSLADGDSVTLIGFGTFSVSQREARTGRNPSTGAKINIPAKKVAKFSAGKALKDAVA